jgi:hypothetical protein
MKKFMPKKLFKMTPKRTDVLTKINIMDDVGGQFGKLEKAIKKTSKVR